VPSAGGSPRKVGTGILWASSPVWSPDGGTLLFSGSEKSTYPESLYTVPSQGGNASRVQSAARFTGPGPLDARAWLSGDRVVVCGFRSTVTAYLPVRSGTLPPLRVVTLSSGQEHSAAVHALEIIGAPAGIQRNTEI